MFNFIVAIQLREVMYAIYFYLTVATMYFLAYCNALYFTLF